MDKKIIKPKFARPTEDEIINVMEFFTKLDELIDMGHSDEINLTSSYTRISMALVYLMQETTVPDLDVIELKPEIKDVLSNKNHED